MWVICDLGCLICVDEDVLQLKALVPLLLDVLLADVDNRHQDPLQISRNSSVQAKLFQSCFALDQFDKAKQDLPEDVGTKCLQRVRVLSLLPHASKVQMFCCTSLLYQRNLGCCDKHVTHFQPCFGSLAHFAQGEKKLLQEI